MKYHDAQSAAPLANQEHMVVSGGKWVVFRLWRSGFDRAMEVEIRAKGTVDDLMRAAFPAAKKGAK